MLDYFTKERTIQALLWLLIINLGIAMGAGLYETIVEGPQWLHLTDDGTYIWDAAEAREANSGLRFWAYVTTGPLTILTILSLIFVWKADEKVRKWWLISIAFLLIDRAMTFAYFIPTMIELMEGGLSNPQAVETARQWFSLNTIRHIASGLTFLTTIKTFSVFYMGKK